MKHPTPRIESLLLILIGIGSGLYALVGNYGLLMNPRYKALTVIGALLVLAMGLSAWFSSHKRSFSGATFLLLLVAITLLGQPLWRDANSAALSEPDWQHLSGEIDQARFPSIELPDLFFESKDSGQVSPLGDFTTLGVVKRLPELDRQGRFVLMRMMMVCCVADAMAVGFQVPHENVEELTDGEWMLVCGKLGGPGTPLETPPFRFGTAMFSTVSEAWLIEPEKVVPYDRTAGLPTLAESLDSDRLGLFREALLDCGLLEMLEGEGPYTVFAPVNEAMERLQQLPPDNGEDLVDLLSGHIIPGRYYQHNLYELDSLHAVNGREVAVQVENGKIRIEGSRLLFKNKEARNGVIHIIHPAIPGR